MVRCPRRRRPTSGWSAIPKTKPATTFTLSTRLSMWTTSSSASRGSPLRRRTSSLRARRSTETALVTRQQRQGSRRLMGVGLKDKDPSCGHRCGLHGHFCNAKGEVRRSSISARRSSQGSIWSPPRRIPVRALAAQKLFAEVPRDMVSSTVLDD